MSLVLTRDSAYRLLRSRPAAARRDWGEFAGKACIIALFSLMAASIATDVARTAHVTGLLLLASEALVVALTLFRRSAEVVDRSPEARVLTMISTFGPLLVRPGTVKPAAPEPLTIIISAIGLMIVVLGKLSLGRSFGLTPANRGVVCGGLYRFVRHPIYLGYLITHVGFVIAYPAGWNWCILAAADVALMLRAICEERTLALDAEYRSYMERTRWRVLPGLF